MDCAERDAYTRPLAVVQYTPTSRRDAVVSNEAMAARPRGAATGADLGGSSKYSSESLEGRVVEKGSM